MALKVVEGDLLDCEEKYLCHQTNCVSTRSKHLAKSIFDRFPYANVYQQRDTHSKPGTIIISGDGNDRLIINMMGQFYPGCKYPNSLKDGKVIRTKYFANCLNSMCSLQGTFAFPWRVGCGAAGGDWEIYLYMLKDFAKDKDVTIYRLPPAPITEHKFKTLF